MKKVIKKQKIANLNQHITPINYLAFNHEGNMLLSEENEVKEPQNNYEKMTINTEMLLKEVENLKNLLEAKQETIDLLKLKFGIQTIGNDQRKQG